MKRFLDWLCPMLFIFAFVACTSDGNDLKVEDEEITYLTLTAAESRAAEDLKEFNMNFFKAVVSDLSDEANVVCSPTSASILLSMVANAAEGDVADEIKQAFNCNDFDALNGLSHKYLAALPAIDPDVTFTSANAVWYHNGYTIRPSFEKVVDQYYKAAVTGRNFDGSKAAIIDEINAWCKKETNNIIEKIIEEIPSHTVSVLANAIYFKGAWAKPFDSKETLNMDFNGIKGAKGVKMMHKLGVQSYKKGENFEAVKMNVGVENFEVIFILPQNDVAEFVAGADFNQILGQGFHGEYVDYYLPRFKFSSPTTMELNKSLSKLGITSLNRETPLSMFTENVNAKHFIGQKTGIEFTEEGAEGAAVTIDRLVTSNGGAGSAPEPKVVKFDHPFVFFIREVSTGAVLFAGKISDL